MGLFAFDQQYAMFDATPVQNQFILEYMPSAPGDYVKVYLYGLMRCCHPSEEMTLAQMSHDLNLSEEDIRAAYRHWERRGLVRRVSDEPPVYQYVSVYQQFLMRDAAPPMRILPNPCMRSSGRTGSSMAGKLPWPMNGWRTWACPRKWC